MRKFRVNIRREIKIGAGVLLLVLLIAFTERKQQQLDIQNVIVRLDNQTGNHFLNESDVMSLMGLTKENLMGANVSKLNLRELEDKIKRDRFVKDAEIFSDLKGNLVVNVKLRRPLARMVQSDGPDGYLSEDGTVMPVKTQYPSRVTLISGSFVSGLLKEDNAYKLKEGEQLMALLHKINEDEFWRAQIAQLDITRLGLVTIYPQVSKQLIEFGNMEDLDKKLRKLRIFYKKILPQSGWNNFSRINIEYQGQIVAE